MAKKSKTSATPAPPPVSWRDLPQNIPEGATSALARQRHMRGFFKIYGINIFFSKFIIGIGRDVNISRFLLVFGL